MFSLLLAGLATAIAATVRTAIVQYNDEGDPLDYINPTWAMLMCVVLFPVAVPYYFIHMRGLPGLLQGFALVALGVGAFVGADVARQLMFG